MELSVTIMQSRIRGIGASIFFLPKKGLQLKEAALFRRILDTIKNIQADFGLLSGETICLER
jgi:hypothetical protein